jgi:hypothetical protein
VERKPVLEGGHESKSKRWEKCYAALAGPTLYFFKDEKSKKGGKKPVGFMKMKGKTYMEEPDIPKKKFTFSLGDTVEKCACLLPAHPPTTTTTTSSSPSSGLRHTPECSPRRVMRHPQRRVVRDLWS